MAEFTRGPGECAPTRGLSLKPKTVHREGGTSTPTTARSVLLRLALTLRKENDSLGWRRAAPFPGIGITMRFSLFQKTLGLFLAVSATVAAISNLTFSLTAHGVLVRGLGEEAVRLAEQARVRLDATRFEAALRDPDSLSAIWPRLVEELGKIQEELGPEGVENVYALVLREDTLFVLADPTGDAPPLTERDSVYVPLKMEALERGEARSTPEPYSDEWGTWISGYVPLRSEEGAILALVGVDLPLGAFPLMRAIIGQNLLLSLVPTLILALMVSLWFSRRLTHPVRELTQGLQRVQGGDFGSPIQVSTQDEFGEMAAAFNEMARELQEKDRLRTLFSQAVSPEVAERMMAEGNSMKGELREVTVLFADIRGFTALAESMAARDVIAMLNEYFSVMIPLISEHGGVVDKLVGDEIFAVFGAPVEIPDDALSAVKSALKMQRKMIDFNNLRRKAGRDDFHIGIGLSTGAAIAGGVGSADRLNYTVLGTAVNVGARLCSEAAPGEILLGQTTYLRVKNMVEAEALPPLKVKGISFPLNVFRLSGLGDGHHA